MTKFLRDVVNDWLDRREDSEDCTCAMDEPHGDCWFRLTPAQQNEARVQSFREMLEQEGAVL